jgi:cytochrome P450
VFHDFGKIWQNLSVTGQVFSSHILPFPPSMTGYTIPRNTVVIANLDSVLSDENIFPDPFKFNPDRFLDSDGKLKGLDKVVAFSLGEFLYKLLRIFSYE